MPWTSWLPWFLPFYRNNVVRPVVITFAFPLPAVPYVEPFFRRTFGNGRRRGQRANPFVLRNPPRRLAKNTTLVLPFSQHGIYLERAVVPQLNYTISRVLMSPFFGIPPSPNRISFFFPFFPPFWFKLRVPFPLES